MSRNFAQKKIFRSSDIIGKIVANRARLIDIVENWPQYGLILHSVHGTVSIFGYDCIFLLIHNGH